MKTLYLIGIIIGVFGLGMVSGQYMEVNKAKNRYAVTANNHYAFAINEPPPPSKIVDISDEMIKECGSFLEIRGIYYNQNTKKVELHCK